MTVGGVTLAVGVSAVVAAVSVPALAEVVVGLSVNGKTVTVVAAGSRENVSTELLQHCVTMLSTAQQNVPPGQEATMSKELGLTTY